MIKKKLQSLLINFAEKFFYIRLCIICIYSFQLFMIKIQS
jgi:hypothetical protein